MRSRPTCSIKGCTGLVRVRGEKYKDGSPMYRSYCNKHYAEKYGRPEGSRDRKYKKFPAYKCEICNWKGPCDRHRIIWAKDGGVYIKGNVMILCPNCHRLVHMSLLEVK